MSRFKFRFVNAICKLQFFIEHECFHETKINSSYSEGLEKQTKMNLYHNRYSLYLMQSSNGRIFSLILWQETSQVPFFMKQYRKYFSFHFSRQLLFIVIPFIENDFLYFFSINTIFRCILSLKKRTAQLFSLFSSNQKHY